MKEEGQGDRSRVACQTTSGGDMKLWDDRRIIAEAAKTAINLVGESKRVFNREKTPELACENVGLVFNLVTTINELRHALNAKGACDDPNM